MFHVNYLPNIQEIEIRMYITAVYKAHFRYYERETSGRQELRVSFRGRVFHTPRGHNGGQFNARIVTRSPGHVIHSRSSVTWAPLIPHVVYSQTRESRERFRAEVT